MAIPASSEKPSTTVTTPEPSVDPEVLEAIEAAGGKVTVAAPAKASAKAEAE